MEKFATLVDLDHRVKPDGDKKGADASPKPDGDRKGKNASPNLDDDNIRAECQFTLNKSETSIEYYLLISLYKSFQSGLFCSIKSFFQLRRYLFKVFSL